VSGQIFVWPDSCVVRYLYGKIGVCPDSCLARYETGQTTIWPVNFPVPNYDRLGILLPNVLVHPTSVCTYLDLSGSVWTCCFSFMAGVSLAEKRIKTQTTGSPPHSLPLSVTWFDILRCGLTDNPIDKSGGEVGNLARDM
jgi:hypothetical protein